MKQMWKVTVLACTFCATLALSGALAQMGPSIEEILPDTNRGTLSGDVSSIRLFEATEFEAYGVLNEASLAVTQEVLYRTDGRVDEIRNYHPGGDKLGRVSFEYEADGVPQANRMYLPDGELYGTTHYQFAGERVQVIEVQAADPWMESQHEYVYNDRGVHTETRVYNGQEEIEHRVKVAYNEAGLKQETTVILADGSQDRSRSYHYTRRDQLRQRNTYSADGVLQEILQLSYNDRGDVTERTVYDRQGQLVSSYAFLYDYDQRGNWVRMWIFRQAEQDSAFEPLQVEVREISYHD